MMTMEDRMLLARHETKERLEVYDERGLPVGSVTLPSDPGLFGANLGTVYLSRTVPVSSEPVRPAQAA